MMTIRILPALALALGAGAADASGAPETAARGAGFHGMAICSVTGNSEQVTIVTTGAEYVLTRTDMAMSCRIDPATNATRPVPRLVATLSFDTNLGPLSVESSYDRMAVVQGAQTTFTFISDSLFFVTASAPLGYTHTNLIADAPWSKLGSQDPTYPDINYQASRMWTDGYGGSLHAYLTGAVTAQPEPDATHLTLEAGGRMGHMVFPPKPFDFEALYGAEAQPFVLFAYTRGHLDAIKEDMEQETFLSSNGFGTILLWSDFYEKAYVEGVDPPQYTGTQTFPYLLDSGLFGYRYADPAMVQDFAQTAHTHGFKVITYMQAGKFSPDLSPDPSHPYELIDHQSIADTLQFMREFQSTNGLDGWYFDNGCVRPGSQTPWDVGYLSDNYEFMKSVREDVGEHGIIYHHDSVDVWGLWSGLRAVMIDAYVDYTLTGETGRPSGETADIADPNDPYLRYYSSGYGLSQAMGTHFRLSRRDLPISEAEKNRALTENLNGLEQWPGYPSSVAASLDWQSFKSHYDRRRAAYLSETFDPDVDWPIDPVTGWFRLLSDIHLDFLTGTSVTVTWETNEPADSEVAYTSYDTWWPNPYGQDGPEGLVYDPADATSHGLVMQVLDGATDYEFRIRSRNGLTGPDEVVWGYAGEFTTLAADADGDGMADDWEILHFGDLGRDGSGDFDGDGPTDLEEYLEGTNPMEACLPGGGHGLLGYWSFDHAHPWDYSGGGHLARVIGVEWAASGGHDGQGAGSFLGTGYVDVGAALADIATYNTGASTITAWVRPNDVNQYNICTHHMGGFDYLSTGITGSGRIRTMARDLDQDVNHWPTSAGAIPADQWVHIAFVFVDRDGYQFYINGVLDKDVENPSLGFHSYGEAAYLGRGFSTDDDFPGLIDDVMVWDRALRLVEVCALAGRHWVAGVCLSEDPSDLMGDWDNDGDVDLADYAEFLSCMGGVDAPVAGVGCEVFQADSDCDLDMVDFQAFQRTFGG